METVTRKDEQVEKQVILQEMLQDFKADHLLLMSILLFILGILLTLNAAAFKDPIVGMLLGLQSYLLAGCILYTKRKSYRLSAWLLITGLFLMLFFILWREEAAYIYYLFALPACLSVLLINPVAGISLAGAVTVALQIRSGGLFPIPPETLPVLLVNWGTVGLVTLAIAPLKSALEIALQGIVENRVLLERARDYQLELQQTLGDLNNANQQLTRLNRLAQNLYHTAEEARRAKEQFVANVSHELRTPLNMILGFGEMIINSPRMYGRKIPPAMLADLSVIVRNSQHLSSLIDDVLDLSQIEAGQMAITREHVLLDEVIESAVTAVRPLYETKGLYLRTEIQAGINIFCDRTRIREVLINLLSNAGRFTEQGGVIIGAKRQENMVLISVADTGPGISIEEQAKLFQPFRQLDSSIRRRYGGTGLGLSISKSFVELHDGKMWVESEKGSGATFYFSLPIEPPLIEENKVTRWINPYQNYEPPTRTSLAPVPILHNRFVVVDETRTLQRLIDRYMDKVEVESAQDLTDACEKLAKTPAQVLLVNTEMPFDALQQIRQPRMLPYGIPAVICSLPQLSEQLSGLKISGYLVKPVIREKLLEVVENFQPPVKKVLIVDDEPDAVQMFHRMLISSDHDYRILTAMDGDQAFALMMEEQPDLVLLDLTMPNMSGEAVLAARSRCPEIDQIPVVIISARDPVDQPLNSPAMYITKSGGMHITEVLNSIDAISEILGATGQIKNSTSAIDPAG